MRFLGLIVVQVDGADPKAAQSVMDRYAQQTRFRVDRVSKTRVESVDATVLEGITASELADAIRVVIAARKTPAPPPGKGDPT